MEQFRMSLPQRRAIDGDESIILLSRMKARQ